MQEKETGLLYFVFTYRLSPSAELKPGPTFIFRSPTPRPLPQPEPVAKLGTL